jgi:exodeoxyribonuclease VII small subunit
MGTNSDKFNFEKALKRLEEIVEKLENEDLPLNKALALFQEGKKLSRICYKKLTGLEQKIQKILEDEEGNLILDDFESQEKENEEYTDDKV